MSEYITGRAVMHATPTPMYQKINRLLKVQQSATPKVKKLEAERRIGEMLKEMEFSKGAQMKGTRRLHDGTTEHLIEKIDAPRLKDVGIVVAFTFIY